MSFIFRTYSTSYCCCYKLMDPWNECVSEWECMWEWMSVRERVCGCTQTRVQILRNLQSGNHSFFNVLTCDLPLLLPWGRWIQSTSLHPISLRSILISSSQLHPGLQSGLFLSGPLKVFVCISCFCHVCCMPCPTLLPWFDHPNTIWWRS